MLHNLIVDKEKTENGMMVQEKKERRMEILWPNVVLHFGLIVSALYGLYLFLIGEPKWQTYLFCLAVEAFTMQGITSGAHRLWAHKSYKAKLPFRLLLTFANTMGIQKSIYSWAREHRVHHKYTDTDADPHNSTRGFFFCHMGWLLVKKHEDVKTKGQSVDLSDLKADPVVMFQYKYYYPLILFCGVLLPVWLPMCLWNESLMNSIFTNISIRPNENIEVSICRYVYTLHITFCINSVAHMFGSHPYDMSISAVQNKYLGFFAFGEGWHNYHHVFPWDYKADEFGFGLSNISAHVIDFMAVLGLAYDLKTTNPEIIRKRCLRTGNSSRQFEEKHFDHKDRDKDLAVRSEAIWGWDDKELKEEDRQFIEIHNKIE